MSSFYMLILGAAVRFLHFALFEGTLLSLQFYAVDTVVCLIFGLLGFRVTRAAPDDDAIQLDLRPRPGSCAGRGATDAIAGESGSNPGDFCADLAVQLRQEAVASAASPDRLRQFIKGRSV